VSPPGPAEAGHHKRDPCDPRQVRLKPDTTSEIRVLLEVRLKPDTTSEIRVRP
jgi:hypothetical protein